jgi:2-(1,2-epoxy-1,2-dihydrophenyl)acetyl-CoA isomerase
VQNPPPGAGERDVPADAHHFQVPVLLHEMPAITVAAVNGACAGAGFGWACGCDLRVAARSAMFNTAFLNVAVAGDMGLPWSLPRLVGSARARELSFFSEKFSAEEAHRIGLVARVWDDGVFREEVAKLIARLAGAAPLALKTMKAHYLAAESGGGFGDYVSLETSDHLRIVRSADTQEAFRAFLEKRAPVFAGR